MRGLEDFMKSVVVFRLCYGAKIHEIHISWFNFKRRIVRLVWFKLNYTKILEV